MNSTAAAEADADLRHTVQNLTVAIRYLLSRLIGKSMLDGLEIAVDALDGGTVVVEEEVEVIDDGMPTYLLIILTVVLSTLLIAGLISNILVIAVLSRTGWRRRNRCLMGGGTATTTNAYILNLSAADLLFLIFCAPFQGAVYILNQWPFGLVMCKLAHFLQYCSVYASIWILTIMSVDRYVAIGHPLRSVRWRHPRQAMYISAAAWAIACITSLPWLYLYTVQPTPMGNATVMSCYDDWEHLHDYRKWMMLVVFLIGFIVPSAIIFCMAILVAQSIRLATHQPLLNNGETPRANGSCADGLRRRRRVGWFVFALSLVFFLCWLPHNLIQLWLNFDESAYVILLENMQTVFVLRLVCHMLTYLNATVNPILYSLASDHFRRRLAYECGIKRQTSTVKDASLRLTQRQNPDSCWSSYATNTYRKSSANTVGAVHKCSTASMGSARRIGRLNDLQRPAVTPALTNGLRCPVNTAGHSPTVDADANANATANANSLSVTRVTPMPYASTRNGPRYCSLRVPADALPLISQRLEAARRHRRQTDTPERPEETRRSSTLLKSHLIKSASKTSTGTW